MSGMSQCNIPLVSPLIFFSGSSSILLLLFLRFFGHLLCNLCEVFVQIESCECMRVPYVLLFVVVVVVVIVVDLVCFVRGSKRSIALTMEHPFAQTATL